MRPSLIALVFIITSALIVISYNSYSRDMSIETAEKYFSYHGRPVAMSTIKLTEEFEADFYVATGSHEGSTATLLLNSHELGREPNDSAAAGRLLMEIVPEWLTDSPYEYRFRAFILPVNAIALDCEIGMDDCYFQALEGRLRTELSPENPQSVDSQNILLSRQKYQMLQASNLQSPTDKLGCYPTDFTLINYNGQWHTSLAVELCLD